MSVVIFNPAPELFEHYKADKSVIFYTKDGWWVVKESVRVCEGRLTDYNDISVIPSISNLIAKVREFGPLWSRWMARGDQYELVYREALLNILEVSQGLVKYSIRIAIFNTGVTHHISTMIFEIACVSVNVKQVFLYTNNIMLGRLLPLFQDKSIKDRSPISVRFSEKEAAENVNRFIRNRQLGGAPESGGELPNRREESVLIAMLSIAKILIKNILRPLKVAFTGKKARINILNRFYDYPVSVFFGQVIQQYFSLKFYKQKSDKKKLISIQASK